MRVKSATLALGQLAKVPGPSLPPYRLAVNLLVFSFLFISFSIPFFPCQTQSSRCLLWPASYTFVVELERRLSVGMRLTVTIQP